MNGYISVSLIKKVS